MNPYQASQSELQVPDRFIRFTWVELVVCVGIIGIIYGLLVPEGQTHLCGNRISTLTTLLD